MGSRPEVVAPPEIFYDDDTSHKYTSNSRNIQIQESMSERALEVLNLPEDGVPKLLLDIDPNSKKGNFSKKKKIKVKILISCISELSLLLFKSSSQIHRDESENLAWHAVASWTWDAQDETCGICRMAFDGCCPDCKLPGDDCPLIWGACNHAFHLHCILKWVNSQTSQAHCPMCRREWQFKG
ncbi:uncharacterized protein [Medicago truncatula]|uniref:uncharacterized protein n=1 Tax=Medicago truncatula TaxID=3880 RepID=UPI001966CF8D|nr:uncharacterized protein LOC11418690 [Medicago truncatula]